MWMESVERKLTVPVLFILTARAEHVSLPFSLPFFAFSCFTQALIPADRFLSPQISTVPSTSVAFSTYLTVHSAEYRLKMLSLLSKFDSVSQNSSEENFDWPWHSCFCCCCSRYHFYPRHGKELHRLSCTAWLSLKRNGRWVRLRWPCHSFIFVLRLHNGLLPLHLWYVVFPSNSLKLECTNSGVVKSGC